MRLFRYHLYRKHCFAITEAQRVVVAYFFPFRFPLPRFHQLDSTQHNFINYKFRITWGEEYASLRVYSLLFRGKVALPNCVPSIDFYMFSPSTDKLLKEYMRAMFMHTLYRLTTLNTELISIRVFFFSQIFRSIFRGERLERVSSYDCTTERNPRFHARPRTVISTGYRFVLNYYYNYHNVINY